MFYETYLKRNTCKFYQVIIMISTESRINNTIPSYFMNFPNVVFARVNFTDLVARTSASKLWTNGTITKTGHFLNNISNILRTILLLCFGGVYFDSDVISVKQVPRPG